MALLAQGPADARRVSIDEGGELDTGACGVGYNIPGPTCFAIALPSAVTIGGVRYTSFYLFDEGFITFGSRPASSFTDTSKLSLAGMPAIGVTVVPVQYEVPRGQFAQTPPLSTTASSVSMYWRDEEHVWTPGFSGVDPDTGLDIDVPGFLTSTIDDPHAFLTITKVGRGQLLFTFPGSDLAQVSLDGTEQYLDFGDGNTNILVGSVVPEPSSWALLIAGFGLVGVAVRKRTLATA